MIVELLKTDFTDNFRQKTTKNDKAIVSQIVRSKSLKLLHVALVEDTDCKRQENRDDDNGNEQCVGGCEVAP